MKTGARIKHVRPWNDQAGTRVKPFSDLRLQFAFGETLCLRSSPCGLSSAGEAPKRANCQGCPAPSFREGYLVGPQTARACSWHVSGPNLILLRSAGWTTLVRSRVIVWAPLPPLCAGVRHGGVHGWPFKIHMTYWAAATAAIANAREKTSCLKTVMPRTVAWQAA